MFQDPIVGLPNSRIHIDSKKSVVRVEGHRGAGYLEPENSIKAFKKAIELGLDSVEFDVWLTKDDVPVVLHGYPGGIMEFANGVREAISQIHSDDMRKFTLYNGETVPTLAEVMDTCKDKVCLNIEIKEVREEVIEKVLDLIEERNMFDQVTFSSFNHYLREKLIKEMEIRKLDHRLTFGFLMRVIDPTMPNYGVQTRPGDSINIDIRFLERSREECLHHIAQAKKAHMKVIFWFPMEYTHEENFYDDMIRIGTDVIITNKPIILNEYLVMKEAGI